MVEAAAFSTSGGYRRLLLVALSAFVLLGQMALVAWALVPTLLPAVDGVLLVSDSMTPKAAAGSVLLLGSAEGTLPPGAIVTFEDPARPGRLVTHRVVEQLDSGPYLVQGDANRAADRTPVPADRIQGRGRLVVPYVGRPVIWVRNGAWAPLVLWLTISGSAVVVAARAIRSNPPLPCPGRQPPAPEVAALRTSTSAWRWTFARGGVTAALVALLPFTLTASDAAFTATSSNTGNSWTAGTWVAPPGSQEFTNAGNFTFTVPDGHHTVTVEAWGAQGGGAAGGLGGYASGDIAVMPGETLTIRVGAWPGGSRLGGFNGGGNGGASDQGRSAGGGGGGASDVRQGSNTLDDRVVVAGGGGGDSRESGAPVAGGSGGGNTGGTGGPGGDGELASGGTQFAGGTTYRDGQAGWFGWGGAGGGEGCSGNPSGSGGGGGGGYYGGGGGRACRSGGGGSGYVTGDAENRVLENGVNAGHGRVTVSWGD